jgi:hypothetical protein
VHVIAEGADTGQHDAFGLSDSVRIVADKGLVTCACVVCCMRQRLFGGAQVSRAVIDNGDNAHGSVEACADACGAFFQMNRR